MENIPLIFLQVTIRGPKPDVERAQKLLTDLAKDKEVNLHEDTVIAKPEFHRFLIGKGGSKINKVSSPLFRSWTT